MRRRQRAWLAVSILGLIGVCVWRLSQRLPTFQTVQQSYTPSDIQLLDRHGEVLSELRINHEVRRLSWITLDEIPDHMKAMMLNAEDKRFYGHHGVDFLALGSALVHAPFQKRGASTVTMQVSGMIDPFLKRTHRNRSYAQKALQIMDAWLIETKWTKSQILEAYFNLSYYRGELQGIHAATEGLFQKSPSGLTMEESAVLAASVQQPSGAWKKIMDRAYKILLDLKTLSDCESLMRTEETIHKSYTIEKKDSWAPHVARLLLSDKKESIQSTLDKDLQMFSVETIQRQLEALQTKNVNDAAVLVLDNQSGEVLSYVGNSGKSESYYVDGVRSLRQAGSTLKPFLYGLSFDQKLLTPNSILNDAPLEIPVSSGLYRPKNYDERFHGKVKVKTALGSSMNVPAVRTIQLTGVDNFVKILESLGFADLHESEFYGPSLALGSADVTLWQLTNAYRALANQGIYSEASFVKRDRKKTQVFSSGASYLIGDILSKSDNRSLAFGLSSPLSGKVWFAAKTGTSKDMRDNWCVGYSDRYTVGVWVGNFSGLPMWDVTGVTGAAPIFNEIIHWLHQESPSLQPQAPDDVIQTNKHQWFLVGTEPTTELKEIKIALPKIIYPSGETIFAWDPDIPVESQKILFEAKNYNPKWSWILNDSVLGRAKGPWAWKPNQNGKFELALIDERKKVLDKVQFEVRGVSPQKH